MALHFMFDPRAGTDNIVHGSYPPVFTNNVTTVEFRVRDTVNGANIVVGDVCHTSDGFVGVVTGTQSPVDLIGLIVYSTFDNDLYNMDEYYNEPTIEFFRSDSKWKIAEHFTKKRTIQHGVYGFEYDTYSQIIDYELSTGSYKLSFEEERLIHGLLFTKMYLLDECGYAYKAALKTKTIVTSNGNTRDRFTFNLSNQNRIFR